MGKFTDEQRDAILAAARADIEHGKREQEEAKRRQEEAAKADSRPDEAPANVIHLAARRAAEPEA